MKVRTRIAPSPTGGLHIGHIRTMLYDYALANKHAGEFIVRIEDTDQNRYVEGAVENILKIINEYGLTYNEGPIVGGKFGPYVQSERLEIYRKYSEELVEKDLAYYCFLTPEETEELQKQSRLENKKLRSPYRESTKDEINKLKESGKDWVIRLKVPENTDIEFDDAVLGHLKFNTNEVDDQVLIKSDGFPTYHLAVVIDDHLMEVTHILRGNDWLSSTPKHVLLYKAFGWEMPIVAHLPNLKEKDSNKKLSKRHGAVFAVQFLQEGYLADALLNFLMLLGWSSPEARVHGEKEKEIYSLKEFTKLFSLDRVQKTALVSFDREKLLWFNKEYIKSKSNNELKEIFVNWYKEYAEENDLSTFILQDYDLEEKIGLIKDRATTLKDILTQLAFFYKAPKNIEWKIKQTENTIEIIDDLKKEFFELFTAFDANSKNWKHEDWEPKMRAIGDKYSKKHGDIFMVLRLAIVGSPFSPPLFEAMQLLGKNEVLKRLTA